ncbi:MAG TPA: YfiR family protein [Verrucomicrobiae bacterium]|nr:YfiR family protein [Verrucomicrobiae bacterium]
MFIRAVILSLAGLLLTGARSAPAQESQPSEYQLKAAFLYNFAKFVEWPASALPTDSSPFIIGILGENSFHEDLRKTVAGKKISEHPVSVVSLSSVAEATNCHMLFISSSDKNQLAEIFKRLQAAPVLTVGETEQFLEAGGMIGFVREANKIRFQIKDETAKAARLKISSKLLGLAVRPAR